MYFTENIQNKLVLAHGILSVEKRCYSINSTFYNSPTSSLKAVAASAESFDTCPSRQPLTILTLIAGLILSLQGTTI
jgi:hypothetical protein